MSKYINKWMKEWIYLKDLLAILWNCMEYFAMICWKRSLSKSFGPSRISSKYTKKSLFLNMSPKALLMSNLAWKLALCPHDTMLHLLKSDSLGENLCYLLSQWHRQPLWDPVSGTDTQVTVHMAEPRMSCMFWMRYLLFGMSGEP